jgi:hypothetical protein
MTMFRTTCPRCDEVEVPSEGILYSVLERDRRDGCARGGYGFVCPSCGDPVWKGGRDRVGVFSLLEGAGLVSVQDAAERIVRELAPPRRDHRHRR